MMMQAQALDDLLSEDHEARLVWQYVEGLDLSRLYGQVRAVARWFGVTNDPLNGERAIGRCLVRQPFAATLTIRARVRSRAGGQPARSE